MFGKAIRPLFADRVTYCKAGIFNNNGVVTSILFHYAHTSGKWSRDLPARVRMIKRILHRSKEPVAMIIGA